MANIVEAFVALDTSKLRNAVAIAEAGRTVRFGFWARSRTGGDREAGEEAWRQV
jgi:hypothetical protein